MNQPENPPGDPLEARYRAWLRLLPAGYRQVWEEDMVATFLDGAQDIDEADRAEARPTWSESASVVGLALRLRLGAPGATPGAVQVGAAVRLFALVALLALGVLSLLTLIAQLWMTGRIPGVAMPGFIHEPFPRPDLWRLAWDSRAAWTGAFFVLVLGHRRVAQALALLAALPTVLGGESALGYLAHGVLSPFDGAVRLSLVALGAVAPVVALFAGFHRDAPAVRRGPWLAAFGVGIVGVYAAVPVAFALQDAVPFDEAGLFCVAMVIAGVVFGLRDLVARDRRTGPAAADRPARALAFALLGLAILGIRLATLTQYRYLEPVGIRTQLLIGGAAEAAAVLGVVVVAAVVVGRSLRRVAVARPRPAR